MIDAATRSAVMAELAAKRWRGQVSSRLARELVPRVDELPPIERRALLDALTGRAEGEQPRDLAGLASTAPGLIRHGGQPGPKAAQ